MLTYGAADDQTDEYIRMGEPHALLTRNVFFFFFRFCDGNVYKRIQERTKCSSLKAQHD
jgi:hypothetical protein